MQSPMLAVKPFDPRVRQSKLDLYVVPCSEPPLLPSRCCSRTDVHAGQALPVRISQGGGVDNEVVNVSPVGEPGQVRRSAVTDTLSTTIPLAKALILRLA